MDNKCYRVVPMRPDVPADDPFLDRVYAEIPAERPGHPDCYEGEWVCAHAPCPVRAVRLRVKAYYHARLPRLRCPLCLRTLDFRHWLTIIALREVPAETLAAGRCPAPRGRQAGATRKQNKKTSSRAGAARSP